MLPWENCPGWCLQPRHLESISQMFAQEGGFLPAPGCPHPPCQSVGTTHCPRPKCGEEAPGLQAVSLNQDREKGDTWR